MGSTWVATPYAFYNCTCTPRIIKRESVFISYFLNPSNYEKKKNHFARFSIYLRNGFYNQLPSREITPTAIGIGVLLFFSITIWVVALRRTRRGGNVLDDMADEQSLRGIRLTRVIALRPTLPAVERFSMKTLIYRSHEVERDGNGSRGGVEVWENIDMTVCELGRAHPT